MDQDRLSLILPRQPHPPLANRLVRALLALLLSLAVWALLVLLLSLVVWALWVLLLSLVLLVVARASLLLSSALQPPHLILD